MPSKSVTLYIDADTLAKVDQFAAGTLRSKSQAAEYLILHGLANTDPEDAMPKKVDEPQKPTKSNTRVKKRKPVTVPRAIAAKARQNAKKGAVKTRGRPAKQKVEPEASAA